MAVNTLALDVGGTAVKAALIDRNNQISNLREFPSEPGPAPVLVEHALAAVQAYDNYDVLAVSMTGQIDHVTQTVRFRSNLQPGERPEYPVGQVLHRAVGKPVFVLNDANAATLGEGCFGAARGCRNFLCLTYGTGVGGGIVLNGSLLTGRRGIAGEIGYMVTHVGGLPGKYNQDGAYQQYASTTALVREGRKVVPELENARQLFDLLPAKPALQCVVDGWVDEIAEGLRSLTYIFDPECFVLGGGVMERQEVLDRVRDRFCANDSPFMKDVRLVRAQLGNRAGLYGAAAYARWAMAHPHDKEHVGCFIGETK
ncbi:MAG: ROK family protein [Oscillospiraceae bacterium]|nr:ROK family protein [Oscillospiraceae bacterium]